MALEKGDKVLKDLRGKGYLFAIQLRKLRIDAKLTQAEAAKRAQTTVKTLSEYEHRKSLPTLRSLTKLAQVYNHPVEKLLNLLGWGLNPDTEELYPLSLSSSRQLLDKVQNMTAYLNDKELSLVHSFIELLYNQTSKNMDEAALEHKRLSSGKQSIEDDIFKLNKWTGLYTEVELQDEENESDNQKL